MHYKMDGKTEEEIMRGLSITYDTRFKIYPFFMFERHYKKLLRLNKEMENKKAVAIYGWILKNSRELYNEYIYPRVKFADIGEIIFPNDFD